MKVPIQAQPVIRNVSTANHMNVLDNGIIASACPWWKAAGCAAAVAACGGICVASLGTTCVACLAGIGAGDCFSCLT